MAVSRECEIPELFPQPKVIEFLEGFSELAFDVRLDTSNVLPIQRKAVRTILGAMGVRVIANKKKFVVRARVEDASLFELEEIPEECRKDYYELTIQNSEVIIRTPCQEGMVWGAQTLAALFHLVQQGRRLPNLKIRDWSLTPVRGLYMNCAWGADRMALNDWFQVIDIASVMKLNVLGIGIYSCDAQDCLDVDHRPYECLMVPLGEQDDEHVFIDELETVTPHHLRWFNVQADMWRDEEYLPVMQQQNFLKEVVAYGHERGVQVIPSFQFSGKSMLFPKLHPEFAAVGEDGSPLPVGICYHSQALKEYCEKVLGRFLKRYFSGGLKYVHLRFDDGLEHLSEECRREAAAFRCSCSQCRAEGDSPQWLEFAAWIVRMFQEQGVEKVILSGNEVFDPNAKKALSAFLQQDDIMKNVVLCPEGAEAFGFFGGQSGVDSWIAPRVEPEKKLSYQNCRQELKKALLEAEKKNISGVVFETTGDAACIDQVAVLGCAAWEGKELASDDDGIRRRWAQVQFSAGMNSYQEAVQRFGELIEAPLLLACVPFSYFRIGTQEIPASAGYPGSAVRKIAALAESGMKISEEFAALADSAAKIMQEMDKLLANETLGFALKECLDSFRQDAALFAVWLEIFSLLSGVYEAEKNGGLKRGQADKCREMRQRLLEVMKGYQERKAAWMMPRAMQPASEMVAFLDQLAADIVSVTNGKNVPLAWELQKNWFDIIEK